MSFGNFAFDAATGTATDTFTVADGEIPAGGLAPGTMNPTSKTSSRIPSTSP